MASKPTAVAHAGPGCTVIHVLSLNDHGRLTTTKLSKWREHCTKQLRLACEEARKRDTLFGGGRIYIQDSGFYSGGSEAVIFVLSGSPPRKNIYEDRESYRLEIQDIAGDARYGGTHTPKPKTTAAGAPGWFQNENLPNHGRPVLSIWRRVGDLIGHLEVGEKVSPRIEIFKEVFVKAGDRCLAAKSATDDGLSRTPLAEPPRRTRLDR